MGARAGLTVLEVLVALLLSSLIIAGVHFLFNQIATSAATVERTNYTVSADRNSKRFLRELIGSAAVGIEGAYDGWLSGNASEATFHSWCRTPSGWLAPCKATLLVSSADGHGVVLATLETRQQSVTYRIPALQPVRRLIYLADAEDGGNWHTSWSRAAVHPIALGIVLEGDTLIIRIGERG